MTTDDIKKTIDGLCCDLKPMKCDRPLWRCLLWVLLVVSYTSAVAVFIGFHENIEDNMGRADYVFELILAFSIGISASFMAFWLSIPDCVRQQRFLAVPITLLAVQFVWMVEHMFFDGIGDIRENWLSNCWINTAIHTTLPALAVVLLVRRGATVRPCWLATMAVLAVSEFGWIGMRLVCPKDNIGEAYILNFLPYVVLGIVAGFLAKRLFKW